MHPPFFSHPQYQLVVPEDSPATFMRLKTDQAPHLLDLTTRFQPSGIHEFALFSEEEQAFIGGLEYTTRAADQILTFYLWIARAFRERGHGTRVSKAFLRACFEHGYHRVEGAHPSSDTDSERFMLKLGFLPEGIQRSACRVGNDWVDLAHFGILALDAR